MDIGSGEPNIASAFSTEFGADIVAFSKDPEYLRPKGTDDTVPVNPADEVSVATREGEGEVLRGDGDGEGSCRISSAVRWSLRLEFTYRARRLADLAPSSTVSEARSSFPVQDFTSGLRDPVSVEPDIYKLRVDKA